MVFHTISPFQNSTAKTACVVFIKKIRPQTGYHTSTFYKNDYLPTTIFRPLKVDGNIHALDLSEHKSLFNIMNRFKSCKWLKYASQSLKFEMFKWVNVNSNEHSSFSIFRLNFVLWDLFIKSFWTNIFAANTWNAWGKWWRKFISQNLLGKY